MRRIAVALFLVAAPASAECPPAPEIAAAESEILAEIQGAGTEMAARALSNELWELWTQAPDATAQELLDRGMARRASFDLLGARDVLDRLVDYCPGYAEGWNQRAFVHFLGQDYAAALTDLDEALALNPRHVGALSGKALSLIGLGRGDEAQIVLREAVDLNPWLMERHLLDDPPGRDI